jgi:hypothetical protein
MPVKIISGPTNNSQGVIKDSDLAKMKGDFITETTLNPAASRTNVVKSHYCFLYKEQIDDLFSLTPGATILKINFALHLDPTDECNTSYADSLTVVLEAAEDDAVRTTHTSVNEHVLIPAYANKTGTFKINSGNPCCPSQGG